MEKKAVPIDLNYRALNCFIALFFVNDKKKNFIVNSFPLSIYNPNNFRAPSIELGKKVSF